MFLMRFKKLLSLPNLASILIIAQGALLIVDELTPRSFSKYELVIPGSRYGSIVIGSLLVYIALELRKAKRSAWWLAYIFTLISIFFQFIHHNSLLLKISSIGVLLVLVFSYQHFYVSNEINNWKGALKRVVLLTFFFMFVSTVGFLALKKRHFGIDFSLSEALVNSFKELFFGATSLSVKTRQARIFLDLIDVAGYIYYILILASFFRPVTDSFVLAPHIHQQALEILKKFSNSSEDYFKYWPKDKSYFFNNSHSGFVAYKTVKGIAISPADPIDISENRRQKLLIKYTSFALQRGWTPVFAHVAETSKHLYEDVGYKLIKIGASAVVDVDNFLTETAKSKNFRNVINRFEKAGYSYEVIHEGTVTTAQLVALKRVSDSWLRLPSRVERGFFLGYFNEAYLRASRLFVLKDGAGQIVAFANLQPNYVVARASVDLMRHIEDAITNTMDYMFYALMKELRIEGWKELDLGLAPLSNLGEGENIEEKTLKIVYDYTNRWFAFQGLARFKQKFEPNWEGSYLAYKGSRAELPMILYAIDKVMDVKIKKS